MIRAPATPYADVNAVLDELVTGVQAILDPRLVGIYLDGSLALGDFDPAKSDIDFVVVTEDDVGGDAVGVLRDLHGRLARGPSAWGRELEGAYVAREAIRARDPRPPACPCIERGGELEIVHLERGWWVIHRHVLREHGLALVGPPPRTLIDAVGPDDLRRAVAGILAEWWRPMLDDPTRLRNVFYRAYAILTMIRMLYTLEHGTIVTKPAAARWARATLDRRWHPLVDAAVAWSRDTPPDLGETLALIRAVLRKTT